MNNPRLVASLPGWIPPVTAADRARSHRHALNGLRQHQVPDCHRLASEQALEGLALPVTGTVEVVDPDAGIDEDTTGSSFGGFLEVPLGFCERGGGEL